MNYIYDEETNLIIQHNRKENQEDLPAKAFWCKHQNPTLASKRNKGKRGFNGRMQLLTEMKGRLKKVRSPRAAWSPRSWLLFAVTWLRQLSIPMSLGTRHRFQREAVRVA